ncbi:MAG TPA: tyrosine-type recombinase/integrase [Rhizomicrobium sp.]|nr:tyrosine-type recombinase/integrase [Rhizomicrobium sp.]
MSPATVDKNLVSGIAALNLAKADGKLSHFPEVQKIETDEDRRSAPTMGVPITLQYAARLLDAVTDWHLFVFIMILANTLARTTAVFELKRLQFDEEQNTVSLNPPGRRQNKKFRPTLLVTPTLRPWLAAESDPDAFYVSYRGKPIKSIRTVWKSTVKRAGLPKGYTPYSFRHGLSRYLKKRKVDREQRQFLLGHAPHDPYGPTEPSDCEEAIAVIEEFMQELRKLVKVANLDDPYAPALRERTSGFGQRTRVAHSPSTTTHAISAVRE